MQRGRTARLELLNLGDEPPAAILLRRRR